MSKIIRFVRLWPGRITTEKALKLHPHFLYVFVTESPLPREGNSVFCNLRILFIPVLKVLL